MKQLILILLVSGIVGMVAYNAGRQSVPACEEADYKFYDLATDENGEEVQLYVKVQPTGRRYFVL